MAQINLVPMGVGRYASEYIFKYGMDACMSKFDLKAPYKTVEDVYKECLAKGVTWQQLLNFKDYNEKVYY